MLATAFSECEPDISMYERPTRVGVTFDTTTFPVGPFDGRVLIGRRDEPSNLCYAALGHDFVVPLAGMGGRHAFQNILFNYVPNGIEKEKTKKKGRVEKQKTKESKTE